MIENHVTSLELSRRLWELGWRISGNTGLYWCNRSRGHGWKLYRKCHTLNSFPAPLATELLEVLRKHIAELRPTIGGWEVHRFVSLQEKEYSKNDSPCDALAAMLIKLTEDGLIRPGGG